MKICSLYGDGFFYIPGTDTCLKVGGWVRYDQYFNNGSSNNPPYNGGTGLNTRSNSPDYATRSRAVVSFDARSQTEYGTLRAYYRGGMELTTGLTSQYAQGTYYFEQSFIQLGGWTFGRARSFFDAFYAQWGLSGVSYAASGSQALSQNLAAYTAQFGNGLSATLSIEDGNMRRTAIWDATAGPAVAGVNPVGNPLAVGGANTLGPMGPATNGYTTCGVSLVGTDGTNGNANTTNGISAYGCGWGDYAAQQVPDIIGNLRVDQAWGSAQVSGALHQLRANYYGDNFVVAAPTFTGVSPADKWGGAINAGIMINLPWNAGDKFWVEGSYAQGAVAYVGWSNNEGQTNSYNRFNGGSLMNAFAMDAVFANNAFTPMSGLQLSTSASIAAAVEHYWTPALRTSVFGSYAWYNPGGGGNAIMCSSPLSPVRTLAGAAPTGAAALPGCDYSFTNWGVGSRTVWNPVRNLDVAFEVVYEKVETKMDPTLIRWNFGGSGTRPAGLYIPSSEGTWAAMMRVQRNFYP